MIKRVTRNCKLLTTPLLYIYLLLFLDVMVTFDIDLLKKKILTNDAGFCFNLIDNK